MSDIRRTRIEDYLTAVEQVCEEGETERASTGAIAGLLGVSKGTTSSMLKQLSEDKLVDLLPYEGAQLTEAGQQRARGVLRRRRLIELFLSKTLGVAWESVANEAWLFEPATSERLVEMMDQFLEHPEFDPHGDPIPRADGTLPERTAVPLSSCAVGARVVLQRVTKQSEMVLRFLRESGLEVGVEVSITENSKISGVVVLETGDGPRTLGYPIATQLLVREIPATGEDSVLGL